MRKILLGLLVFLTLNCISQTNYYYGGSGDGNNVTSWWTNTNGTGSNPPNFTANNQIFNVQNGQNLSSFSAAWTVSGTGSKVKILSGGTITSGSFNHTLTLDMEANATWIHSNTTYSNLTFGTLDINSNFQLNNSSGFSASRTYPNLIINGVTINPGNTSLTINGSMSIKSGGIFRGTSTGTPTHNIAGSIIVEIGGNWTLTNGTGSPTYNIGGNISNSGSITASTSNGLSVINLTGSTPTIAWGTKTGHKHDINISNSTTATFSDDFEIANGTLTVNGSLVSNGNMTTSSSGSITLNASTGSMTLAANKSINIGAGTTVNFNGRPVTLKASSAGSATFGNIQGTLSNATNVTIEKYIPGNRAFRLLGNPLAGSLAASQLIDNIDITGTGGAANGFTNTGTNNPSAFRYNPTAASTSGNSDGWQALTNITNTVNQYEGLRVLVRGAKNEGLTGTSYTPSAVTLDVTGTLNTGNQVVTLTHHAGASPSFNLISNPYVSNVDLNATIRGSNVGGNFYVWKPSAGTGGKGAYLTYGFGSSYIMEPLSAVFLTASANTNNTITFSESNKTTGAATDALLNQSGANPNDRLELALFANNNICDVVILRNHPQAQETADTWDGIKMKNPTANLYILIDGKEYAVDARNYQKIKDQLKIPLSVTHATAQQFTLKTQLLPNNGHFKYYLKDNYLNKEIEIDENFVYDFEIDPTIAATQGNDRFVVTIKPSHHLTIVNEATDFKMQVMSANPARNQIIINYQLKNNQQAVLQLVGVDGRKLEQQSLKQNSGTVVFNVSGKPSGMYIVQLINGKASAQEKIMIQ